jgi:uncharacterized protein
MKSTVKSIIIIFGTFTAYLTANIIAGFFFGVYYAGLYGEEGSSEGFDVFFARNTNLLLITVSVVTLIIFWAAFTIRRKSFSKGIGLRKIRFSAILKSIFVGGFFSLFLFALISLTQVYRLFPSHGEVIESIIPAEGNFLLIFLSIAIVVPIFEEVMHRGIIYHQLKKSMALPFAIIAQALIFGVFHLNWLQGIYAFLGGIVLALLYEYTQSLGAPIMMHIGWNGTSLLIPPVYSDWMLGGIMIFSLGMLILLLKKLKENRVPTKRYRKTYESSIE